MAAAASIAHDARPAVDDREVITDADMQTDGLYPSEEELAELEEADVLCCLAPRKLVESGHMVRMPLLTRSLT
jgi:hypothetical protein